MGLALYRGSPLFALDKLGCYRSKEDANRQGRDCILSVYSGSTNSDRWGWPTCFAQIPDLLDLDGNYSIKDDKGT